MNRKRKSSGDYHSKTLPTSQLYWMLRPATDAAIDRALASPIDKLKAQLTSTLQEAEWFEELQEKVATLQEAGEWDDVDDA